MQVHETIYVVVPVFNRKALLERFLIGLRNQTFRYFEIIVVDDGSTDGTADMLRHQFEEVHYLHGDGSLWWTGAINVGIRYAIERASRDDAVLVINDDLEVGSNYLERLHRVWKSMPRTLIGSVVVEIDRPDVIFDGGRTINWWTAKCRVLNETRKLSEFPDDHYEEVSVLTGRGTLVPIELFNEIGLYDERHFQQCGDTELPVRAKLAGYRLVVSHAAIVNGHMQASDNINVTAAYSVSDLYKYFFGVRSYFRLRDRFFFAIKTHTNPLSCLTFWVCDLGRIFANYLRRLRFDLKVSSLR